MVFCFDLDFAYGKTSQKQVFLKSSGQPAGGTWLPGYRKLAGPQTGSFAALPWDGTTHIQA